MVFATRMKTLFNHSEVTPTLYHRNVKYEKPYDHFNKYRKSFWKNLKSILTKVSKTQTRKIVSTLVKLSKVMCVMPNDLMLRTSS